MKKRLLFIIVLLSSTISFGQVNKIFKKALKEPSSKEKIELLNTVISMDSKHLDAYFERAITKNELGDYHGAIMDYSKIIFYKPDADSYYNRGNSKFNLEDYIGAKNDYQNALKLAPHFLDAELNLACSKYFLADYKGAIEDLDKIIKTAPTTNIAYTQRANAYLELNKPLIALVDFSVAISFNPNSENYFNRGLALLNINYFKKAKKDFDNCLALDSNNISAYFFRGASHLFLGKYTNAISDFKINTKYNALDFDALLGLALTYYKMNDKKKAKSNLKKAQSILLSTNTEKANSLSIFDDTYWFKNHFYFFKQHIEEINNTQ